MVIKLDSKPEIGQAVNLLRAGKLVAFPTETVYGLGADASNEAAIRRIFEAKGRPADHPLIVHIGKFDQLFDWAEEISPEAIQLAKTFWPGPLTMVLKKQAHVSTLLTGGQDTIAIRMPNQAIALSLLRAFGGGIAAPSANLFTRISPTSAEAVAEGLSGKVDLILDGGLCEIGLESTIVDMTQVQPVILRKGMITAEAISQTLGKPIQFAKQSKTQVPGMHAVHYAPMTHTLLMRADQIITYLKNVEMTDLPLILLLHTTLVLPTIEQTFYVKMPDQAHAYAHELYRVLRSLDREKVQHLIIEDVPNTSEWQAIRDRLQKASGV